jgi:CRISP-associated protein Cas1
MAQNFLQPENFEQAWLKVLSNNGCEGVDGETIASFAAHADKNLIKLCGAVAKGLYKPLPLRELSIPKKDGGWRKLAVPTVRDRIVQQALLNILHPVLECQFESSSFAYRPGRSHQMAVQQVDYWHKDGYDWILDADLVKYFDNLQHSRLLTEVSERFYSRLAKGAGLEAPVAALALSLIEQWISCGVVTAEGLVLPQKGVPQGSPISPILANVYLDDLDEFVASTSLKLVRYADDFVVLGRRRQQVVEAREDIAELLRGMGLRFHVQKTMVTNFKEGFRFLGHTFVGGLVVQNQKTVKPMGKPSEEIPYRLVHTDSIVQPTPMQLALVEALQKTHKPIPPPLYVVFGFKVREEASVKVWSQELFWSTGMSTLYLVRQGTTLRKEQGRFLVRTQEENEPAKSLEVPIQEVDRVLVFGNVQLSTTAIASCLEAKIPVIFLSQWGDYKGHLWSAEYGDLRFEAAQFRLQLDEEFKRSVACQVVLGKLANSKHFLLRLNRKRKSDKVVEMIGGINDVQGTLGETGRVLTLDQLRGYEGVASKHYFTALGELILNDGFTFTERNRRPPKDPVNSMLSFGYMLLFYNVLSLILAEGLNPYLGNLHGSDRKEAFLAFDLVEEFRSPIVDTLVMTLINQKIMRPTDFGWPREDGGVFLLEPGKRVFLKHFEERISKPIAHPDVKTEVSYRRVIQLQVQRYKKVLMDGGLYEPFRRVG